MIKKLSIALIAQLMSILVSMSIILLVPQFLGVGEYAYLQYFILLTGYIGILHFGVNDGLLIALGGKKWSALVQETHGVYTIYLAAQLLFSCVMLFGISLYEWNSNEQKFSWVMLALIAPAINIFGFFSSIVQALNRVEIYAKTVLLSKVTILVVLIALVSLDVDEMKWFVLAIVASSYIALIYIAHSVKLHPTFSLKMLVKSWVRIISYAKSGLNILGSNYVLVALTGGILLIIKNFHGINDFSYATLSFSIVSIFSLFLAQFGTVIYPTLFHLEEDQLRQKIITDHKSLTIFLLIVMLGFPALNLFIEQYLSDYSKSVQYLLLLFPIIVFDGLMVSLFLPILKHSRFERIALITNIISFLVFMPMAWLLSHYQFPSKMVVLTITASYALRYLLTYLFLLRKFFKGDMIFCITIFGYVSIFLIVHLFLSQLVAEVILLIICGLLVYVNKSKLLISFKSAIGK